MMSGGRPDISVVIVNYNAIGQLKQCLASLTAHVTDANVEVIVVDNASADGSASMVRSLFPDVVLIENSVNAGYTQANNTGIEIAHGEYVVLLNNDTEILEHSFSQMVAFMESHPRVGAVAPQLLNPDMTMQGNVKRFPTAAAGLFGRKSILTRLFPRNRFSRRYLLYLEQDMSKTFEVDFASTACLMVRRQVLEEIGMFDAEYFCYWSDADLCHRIKDAGWSIFCEPAALVIHYEHMGGSRAARRSWRSIVDFNRGAYRYYVKNRIRRSWSPMRLLAFVGLSVNAVWQLVSNRVDVFLSGKTGTFLNPAETPAADRAIRSLSSVALLGIVLLAILQAQSALGGWLSSDRSGESSDITTSTPAFEDVDTVDIEWLEEEAQRNPAVAQVLVPEGDAAPRLEDASEAPPFFVPPKPAMPTVEKIGPDEHTFGLVTYMLDPSDPVLDAKIDLLHELGVRSVRMDFRWPLIEPENDSWQFAQFDTAVAKLESAGFDIMAVTAFTPVWASSAPSGAPAEDVVNYPPASLDEYEEFVSTTVARYAGRVHFWQLGIEPDLYLFWRPEPDPAAFVEQFTRGSQAVKAADPSAKVVYPGITTAEKLVFLEETLKLGVADAADIYAVHDYDDSPEGKIREDGAYFASLLKRYSSRPFEFWCTEIGWSTYHRPEGVEDQFIDGVTEEQQRDNLIKRWIIFRDMPVGRVYTWELSDAGTDPHTLLMHLGLVQNDLTPKAAFFGIRELMPSIDGASTGADSLLTVEPSAKTLEVHVFETEDDSLAVALWDRKGEEHELDLRLASDDFTAPVRLDFEGGVPTPVLHQTASDGVRISNLAVDGSPTVLLLSRPGLFTDPGAFSPDGDGVRDTTRIGFSLESTQTVTLEVLDREGDLVRVLHQDVLLAAGQHDVVWAGDDEEGSTVPDGEYVVNLEAGASSAENKINVDTSAPALTNVASEFRIEMPDDERPYALFPLWYTLSEPAHVTVDIFNQDGDFFLQLGSERMQSSGRNMIYWPIPAFNHPDGWYWYRVTARDSAGNVVSRDSAKPVHADFSGPTFGDVSFTPKSFSPNADGSDDTATLRYTLSEPADIVASVRKGDGKRYYLYAVRSQVPGPYRYEWNGRAYDPDSRSIIGLPDGDYVLQLTGYDSQGNRSAGTTSVTIRGGDFVGPEVSSLAVRPNLISPDGDGEADLGEISFALDEPADVVLTIVGRGGEQYSLAAMAGLTQGSHSLDWNASVPSVDGGRAFLPSGGYTLLATSTDRAGNISMTRTTFFVETPDPFAPEVDNANVTPSAISPNGDGVRDTAVISFDLRESADIIAFVRDSGGRRYDIFGEPDMGVGYHEIEWRGTGYDGQQEVQVQLPDGAYELCIEASDDLGNVGRHWGEVRIVGTDDSPLAISGVSVEHIDRGYRTSDGRDRMLRFEYSLSRRADVMIALRSLSGRHYFIGAFADQGPGEHSLEWDGTAFDPVTNHSVIVHDGTYTYLIEAISGSSPGVTASERVSIDLRSPE